MNENLKITIDDDLEKSIEIAKQIGKKLDELHEEKIRKGTGTAEDYQRYFRLTDELEDAQQMVGLKVMCKVKDLPF